MTRKTFPTSTRAAIWRAHTRRCIYCTELVSFADLDIDHIIPDKLKNKPEELAKILNDYGLSKEFDIDGFSNLVPSHRRCNLQKTGNVLPKSRALHFLGIAESKQKKAHEIEKELKQQLKKDEFAVRLQVALDEGLVSLEDIDSLVKHFGESQNAFEVLSSFPFADEELKGFLSSEDIDSLYDRPILPRRDGLGKLVLFSPSVGKEIEVRTCREWAESTRDGYFARSTYDIKEETSFKQVYALVAALAQASVPKHKYISDGKISIANFDLLPVTMLPVLSRDSADELCRLESDGVRIPDMIAEGRVKVVSSSPLSLILHFDYMGLYLKEILRADLNNDEIEDMLVGNYEWALQGTYGSGGTRVITRLGDDQPFTVVNDAELEVS